jgi:serine/threonine protein kinase
MPPWSPTLPTSVWPSTCRTLNSQPSTNPARPGLGSPSFLPPEQASANRGPIGPHADIYALGAILYFLLTSRPPFQADAITDTLQQVLNEEPVPPRMLNWSVPRDLETICLVNGVLASRDATHARHLIS